MKKFVVFLLVSILCGLQMVFGQDVIIGTVRTDGFQKITKGAFWNKRPESKMIYNGSYPPGFKVYTLESDYFVHFVDNEHNQDDKNYIVFPKGEKVYVNQEGQYFAAICGNKIEFLRPVDMVSIVKKENSSSVTTSTSNPVSVKKDTIYVERERQQELSDRPERAERSNENTYYINNATPYGYYGLGYYYGYYGGRYCYRYYEGPVYHFNGGNNHHNGYTGNNHNYTGSNYHFTGGNNYSTGQGHGSTGRGNSNTGQGHMSGGRGNQNTSNGYGGGRSNVSFSSSASFSRSSGNRGGRSR